MNTYIKISSFIISLTLLSCNNSENSAEADSCLTGTGTLQDGVVAFYPFSDGSLDDFSGNNYNLTNSTSAIAGMDRDGNPNCAFSFNQDNDDFLFYDNPIFLNDLPATGFSISLWYKSNEVTDDYAVLISRDNVNNCVNTYGQWSIRFINMVFTTGINGYLTVSRSNANEWQHLVMTSNNDNLSFYRNGLLEQSTTEVFCTNPNPTINSGSLFLGKFYDGSIDDVIIYDRILTSAEVTQLYNLPVCCD